VRVGVRVAVAVNVDVGNVAVGVRVTVGVEVGRVAVGVRVSLGVGVGPVGVGVGVLVGGRSYGLRSTTTIWITSSPSLRQSMRKSLPPSSPLPKRAS
jgi:hypothetical protein